MKKGTDDSVYLTQPSKVICMMNAQREEVLGSEEDRGVSAAHQAHIFTQQVVLVLGLRRWGGVPQVREGVEHVQRPRGRSPLCVQRVEGSWV